MNGASRTKLFFGLRESLLFWLAKEKAIGWDLFLWTPVCVGVGIGLYLSLSYEPSAWVFPVLAILALGARWGGQARLFPWVIVGFMAAGLATFLGGTPMLDAPRGPVMVFGRVAAIEPREGGKTRLLIDHPLIERLSEDRTPEKIYLTVNARLGANASFAIGQRFSGVARLMPYSTPLYPGGFDFRRNAYFKRLGATGYVMGRLALEPPESAPPLVPETFFSSLRAQLQDEIRKTLPGDRAGLAIILATGDKNFLSLPATEAMRAVGLAHLLAIAGLHVGVVGGIVFFIVRLFLALSMHMALRWPIKKIAAGAALFATGFYTLLVGAPVPTRRAFLMAGLFFLGVMLDRVSLSLRSVALAALAILLLWPFMLLSPGFQLSFAAVTALIAVGTWRRQSGFVLFPERKNIWARGARHIFDLAAMSVVATVGTLPFCLYHFQELGLYAALANALAIPLTTFYLMPLCIAAILCFPLGLMAWPLKALSPGLGALLDLSAHIAALPGAHAVPPVMPTSLMLLALAGGLLFCLHKGPSRFVGLFVLTLALALGLATPRPWGLIAADGQTLMLREKSGQTTMYGLSPRPNAFLKETYARAMGAKPEEVPYQACIEESCTARAGDQEIALIAAPAALPQACALKPRLVVDPDEDAPCAAPMLGYSDLSLRGASALTGPPDALQLVFANPAGSLRPWSQGWADRPRSSWLKGAWYSLFKRLGLGYRTEVQTQQGDMSHEP